MGSIYVICSRQFPNGDGIYTLLYALYKYSTSITNQPTKEELLSHDEHARKEVKGLCECPEALLHFLNGYKN